MTDQLPSVSQADTDGDGLAKRTRRPALSCVECRMRKVKCDRGKPCGACIRIKSKKCTYRPPRSGAQRLAERGFKVGKNKAASIVYNVPGLTGEQQPPRSTSSLAKGATAELTSHTTTQNTSLLAILLAENERLHSATGQGETPADALRPTVDTITDIPGSFQKSKFFGQSHWMNALEPVSTLFMICYLRQTADTTPDEALGDANTNVNPATDRVEVNKSTELYKTVAELKSMARILKTARMMLPAIAPETLSTFPPRVFVTYLSTATLGPSKAFFECCTFLHSGESMKTIGQAELKGNSPLCSRLCLYAR